MWWNIQLTWAVIRWKTRVSLCCAGQTTVQSLWVVRHLGLDLARATVIFLPSTSTAINFTKTSFGPTVQACVRKNILQVNTRKLHLFSHCFCQTPIIRVKPPCLFYGFWWKSFKKWNPSNTHKLWLFSHCFCWTNCLIQTTHVALWCESWWKSFRKWNWWTTCKLWLFSHCSCQTL